MQKFRFKKTKTHLRRRSRRELLLEIRKLKLKLRRIDSIYGVDDVVMKNIDIKENTTKPVNSILNPTSKEKIIEDVHMQDVQLY